MSDEAKAGNKLRDSAIGIFGILVSFCTFLALFYSWSFAKGFYGKLGIPSYSIPFSRGFELFPEIGILFVILSLILLYIGHFLSKRTQHGLSRFFFLYVFSSLFILSCIATWFLNIKIIWILSVIFVIGLFLLGVIGARTYTHANIFFATVIISFLISSSNIFFFEWGQDEARNIVVSREKFITLPFMRELVHFPIVAVSSEKELGFRTPPAASKTEKTYRYLGRGVDLVYLIYTDGDMYYFLEGPNPYERFSVELLRTVGIRKSDVVQIDYFNLYKPPTNYFESLLRKWHILKDATGNS